MEKIINKIFFIIKYIYGKTFFFIFIILNLFIKVRISEIWSSRVGHFMGMLEIYFNKKNNKKNNSLDLFYFQKKVSNIVIKKLVSKKLKILPRFILSPIFHFGVNNLKNENYFAFGNSKHIYSHRDYENFLDKNLKNFELEKKEKLKSEQIIKSLKINFCKNKVVTVHLRDDQYLNNFDNKNDWSYTNYRNVNINNYLKTVNYLQEKGYFVVRTGNGSNQKFSSSKINEDFFLDLNFVDKNRDLIELYTMSISKFFIGTDSGGSCMPLFMYKIPTLFTNLVSISDFHSCLKSHIIFKKIYSNENKKFLNLDEIFNNDLDFLWDPKNKILNKYKIIDNDEDEIFNAVKELENKVLQNSFVDQSKLSLKFKSNYKFLFDNKYPNHKWHGDLTFSISESFLNKNQYYVN